MELTEPFDFPSSPRISTLARAKMERDAVFCQVVVDLISRMSDIYDRYDRHRDPAILKSRLLQVFDDNMEQFALRATMSNGAVTAEEAAELSTAAFYGAFAIFCGFEPTGTIH